MTQRMWSALLMLFLASAGHGLAQDIRVEFVPYGGLFLPVADLGEISIPDPDPSGLGTVDVAVNQATAFIFGGRIPVWLGENWGIEGNFAYALSDVKAEVSGVPGLDDLCDDPEIIDEGCDANVWFGSGKVMYRVAPRPDSEVAILLGGGVAVIGRGGDFYNGIEGTTDVGGVLNVGLEFAVSPKIAVRLDVEDYLYSAGPTLVDDDLGRIEADSEFQNDLIFTGGIAIQLGGN